MTAGSRKHQGRLSVLHDEVDAAVTPLAQRHADRLRCKLGCTDCCRDGITVFEIEAERIREHCADVLSTTPHPVGQCAFLDEAGACRVYAHRPYVCRTQGLPLRWIDEDDAGQPVELRDICPLNEEGEPLEEIAEDECWTLGPFEAQLATLQAEVAGSMDLPRVALRDLFGGDGS